MFGFLLRRLAVLIPTFIGVSIIAFAFIRLLPGDPVALLSGERVMSPERHAQISAQLGLDRPVVVQYFDYLGGVLTGDFGTSIVSKSPIIDQFFALFPATVELSLAALVRGFRAVYLGSILLIVLVQLGFLFTLQDSAPSLWLSGILLTLYFVGFNTQEASQPSLVSRLAEPRRRGAALGVYNTLMSLGIFAGGSLGGLVIKTWGSTGIFLVSSGLMLVWMGLAWPMKSAVKR